MERLGLSPILYFALIITILAMLDIRTVFEPPLLTFMLHGVFTCSISLVVSYLSARSYLVSGLVTVLLLGCGTLTFGVTALISASLIGGPNFLVTVQNSGVLLASVFHFSGATLASLGLTLQASKHRKLVVTTAYLGVLVFSALITIASLQNVIPVFFIQGIGATPLRQFVLGSAIALFTTSSLLLTRLYFKSKSDVLYWYSLAMVLITESLFSWFFAKAAGSPISWAGRVAVYLSAIYFLVAILILVKGVRKKMGNEKSQY